MEEEEWLWSSDRRIQMWIINTVDFGCSHFSSFTLTLWREGHHLKNLKV